MYAHMSVCAHLFWFVSFSKFLVCFFFHFSVKRKLARCVRGRLDKHGNIIAEDGSSYASPSGYVCIPTLLSQSKNNVWGVPFFLFFFLFSFLSSC